MRTNFNRILFLIIIVEGITLSSQGKLYYKYQA